IWITMLNGRYIQETKDQAQDIFVFFIITTLGYSIIEKERRVEIITKTIVDCLIFMGFVKLLIFAYSIVTGIGVGAIVKLISSLFGTSLMVMESDDIAISRINFMSDYMLPIAIYLKTREYLSRKKNIFDAIVLAILMYSLIVSMSRFLWFIGIASFLLAIAADIKKKKSIFIVVAIIAVSYFLLSLPSTQEILEFRFSSQRASESDNLRSLQLNAIATAFSNAPMLGNGIGYFTPNLIRSYVARYSYELQIQALYMQIGIIGATSLLLIIIATLLSQAKNITIKEFFVFLALIVMWLAGGFFNPVIISSTGGVSFLLLFTVPDAMKKMKSNCIGAYHNRVT
ncbi:hypothetical protein, partial [Brenneria goodwinii]